MPDLILNWACHECKIIKLTNCVLMVHIFSGHDLNVAAEYSAQKQLFAGSRIEERLRAVYQDAHM